MWCVDAIYLFVACCFVFCPFDGVVSLGFGLCLNLEEKERKKGKKRGGRADF